jgi:KaiC/GvpD/RAD55 family RecA-like ATPase
MAALVPYLNGESKEGISSLLPLIEQYQSLVNDVGKENPDECSLSLREIMAGIKKDGLSWPLKGLNDMIGPVYPGTLGHILARPETGKTAFCVACSAWFAYQLKDTGDKVLFLSNEEGVDRSRSRAYASLIGIPVETLLADESNAFEEVYLKKGGKNIHFIGEVNTIAKVEQNIIRYKPRVVFIDQGPKVTVPGDRSQVEARQTVYNIYRHLATKYKLIMISVGQADNAAENKKWLTYAHIDGSKVGIPGECDYIIGIGRDAEEEVTADNPNPQYYRYFTISKNKLGVKLGRITTRLDPYKNRYIQV